MQLDTHVQFPLTVFFEDGSFEHYDNVLDLEQNLEFFNSDKDKECSVFDSMNRPVYLILEFLSVKKLELKHKYD